MRSLCCLPNRFSLAARALKSARRVCFLIDAKPILSANLRMLSPLLIRMAFEIIRECIPNRKRRIWTSRRSSMFFALRPMAPHPLLLEKTVPSASYSHLRNCETTLSPDFRMRSGMRFSFRVARLYATSWL